MLDKYEEIDNVVRKIERMRSKYVRLRSFENSTIFKEYMNEIFHEEKDSILN